MMTFESYCKLVDWFGLTDMPENRRRQLYAQTVDALARVIENGGDHYEE